MSDDLLWDDESCPFCAVGLTGSLDHRHRLPRKLTKTIRPLKKQISCQEKNMQTQLRKMILDRARQEFAAVSEGCLQAMDEIDRDSESTVAEALSTVERLKAKLEMAVQRLLVLRDAEHDSYLSPYLVQATPASAAAIV